MSKGNTKERRLQVVANRPRVGARIFARHSEFGRYRRFGPRRDRRSLIAERVSSWRAIAERWRLALRASLHTLRLSFLRPSGAERVIAVREPSTRILNLNFAFLEGLRKGQAPNPRQPEPSAPARPVVWTRLVVQRNAVRRVAQVPRIVRSASTSPTTTLREGLSERYPRSPAGAVTRVAPHRPVHVSRPQLARLRDVRPATVRSVAAAVPRPPSTPLRRSPSRPGDLRTRQSFVRERVLRINNMARASDEGGGESRARSAARLSAPRGRLVPVRLAPPPVRPTRRESIPRYRPVPGANIVHTRASAGVATGRTSETTEQDLAPLETVVADRVEQRVEQTVREQLGTKLAIDSPFTRRLIDHIHNDLGDRVAFERERLGV